MTTEKETLSFSVNGKNVDDISVRDISFVEFQKYSAEASADKTVSYFVALRRIRLLKQVVYTASGQRVALDAADIARIPIPVARKIIAALDKAEAKPGKIIRQGDGVSTAIGYELGTPLPISKGELITELEFYAEFYGDVETVMAGSDPIDQTIQLIRTVAKPVHGTLSVLPDTLVNQISTADGVIIAQQVLPRFLEDSAKPD